MWRVILLSVCACVALPLHAQLQVFSCEPEWAELARVIGGEQVQAFSATTAEQDVHYIQARPSLIARLRKADLLVCTGADLEAGWLPVLQRRANNPKVMPGSAGFVQLADHLVLLDEHAGTDRAHGDVHPQGNPHFHLDPRYFVPIAELLANRLAELDPGHADAYRTRANEFVKHWQASIVDWEQAFAGLRGQRIVAHHLDWNYLAAWLGLEVSAMLEPKPGVPPSSGHLAELLQRLQAEPVHCIVRTNYQDHRPAQWLAKRAGVAAVELDYTVAATQTLHEWFEGLLLRIAADCG